MLDRVPYNGGVPTRQISAENPTGEKGKACIWEPDPSNPFLPHSGTALDMGRGWKVRPFIKLQPGETVVLADISGPGCINQFFFTSSHELDSELVLRIYWDDEETPSVESPIGAFFANGHDSAKHGVNSLPIVVAPRNAYISYWQMPFRKRARMTVTHDGTKEIGCVAYRVLYKLYDIPEDVMYFHAQWRRSTTSLHQPEHIILDNISGKGSYVGTYLAWNALSSDWWGEGEVKFYIDGDDEFPTMADNGTEDYFGGSFGFSSFNSDLVWNDEQPFMTPFFGMPLAKINNPTGPRKYSLYRWHIYDSIGFATDLKVTVQTLGVRYGKYRALDEDIASVAYWYQSEPHAAYPELLPVQQRWDR